MMTKSISLSAYIPNATIHLKVVNMKRNLSKVLALIIMAFCLLSCTEDSEKTGTSTKKQEHTISHRTAKRYCF